MPRRSAGILLFRRAAPPGRLEVFLVHPGGPFWARKDLGAWSIPKGEFGDDETALAAAVREFAEETGSALQDCIGSGAAAIPLAPIQQKGGKIVHAFAVEGNIDASAIRSNPMKIEWPPRSGGHRVPRGRPRRVVRAQRRSRANTREPAPASRRARAPPRAPWITSRRRRPGSPPIHRSPLGRPLFRSRLRGPRARLALRRRRFGP